MKDTCCFEAYATRASGDEHDATLPLANGVVVLEDTEGSRSAITGALGSGIVEGAIGVEGVKVG